MLLRCVRNTIARFKGIVQAHHARAFCNIPERLESATRTSGSISPNVLDRFRFYLESNSAYHILL